MGIRWADEAGGQILPRNDCERYLRVDFVLHIALTLCLYLFGDLSGSHICPDVSTLLDPWVVPGSGLSFFKGQSWTGDRGEAAGGSAASGHIW